MSTATKIVGGTVALGGTTGTVGYGVYDHSTYTLEYLIKQEDNSVVFVEKKDDNKQLKALIKSYRSVTDSKKKFEDSELDLGTGDADPEDKHVEALLNKCNELKQLWVRFGDFEELKNRVKDWCTEIKTVEDVLKKEGKQIIKEDGDFKSFIESKKDDTSFKTFLNKESETLNKDTHFFDHKSKCKEALEKTFDSSDYQTSLENSRKYCVKSST